MPFPESELVLNQDGSVYHLSLKPGNIADTIIAVEDPGRVHSVSHHFDAITFEMNRREFITHTGVYKGKKITVVSTGMGTDNIEIVLTELDALVNIDLKKRELKSRRKKLKIIRIGTSGSLQQDLKLDEHVVTDFAIGFDSLMLFYNLKQTEFELSISEKIANDLKLDFQPYCVRGSEKLLKKFGLKMATGNTVTTPGFYAPQGRRLRLNLRMPNLIKDLNYFHHDNFWLSNFDLESAGYYAMARLLGHEMISVNTIISNRISNKFSKNPAKSLNDLIQKVLERVKSIE